MPGCGRPDCAEYQASHEEHFGWLALDFPDAISVELSQDGEPVTGAYNGVAFTPTMPLSPATRYDWSVMVDSSCAPVMGAFTTHGLGGPVTSPSELIGRTFGVSPSPVDGSGQNVSVFLVDLARGPMFSLRVDSLDEDTATVTLAPWLLRGSADNAEQATCLETVQVTGSWDGARIVLSGDLLRGAVGTVDYSTSVFGYRNGEGRVDLLDWNLEVYVYPDGDESRVLEWSATVDTRGLGYWTPRGPEPDASVRASFEVG